MTAEIGSKFRKTQRKVLRSIYQCPRRTSLTHTDSNASESRGDVDIVAEDDDEHIEPRVDWIRHVARDIETHMSKLRILDWVVLQRRRQHTWSSHVVRRIDGRLATTLLTWDPEAGLRQGGTGTGQRQGRPRRRGADVLEEFCVEFGVDGWHVIAHSREEWREMEGDFTKEILRGRVWKQR